MMRTEGSFPCGVPSFSGPLLAANWSATLASFRNWLGSDWTEW